MIASNAVITTRLQRIVTLFAQLAIPSSPPHIPVQAGATALIGAKHSKTRVCLITRSNGNTKKKNTAQTAAKMCRITTSLTISPIYSLINYLNPSQTANAVLSALKGGLVDVLILDSNLAEALLKLSEDMPSQE